MLTVQGERSLSGIYLLLLLPSYSHVHGLDFEAAGEGSYHLTLHVYSARVYETVERQQGDYRPSASHLA